MMPRPYESDAVAGAGLAPYAAPNLSPTHYLPASAAGMMPPPPAARSIPTVWGLLSALKRRWVLAGFLGLLAAMAAAAGFWLAAPTGKHQVKAIVEVKPVRTSLDLNNSNVNENELDAFRRDQHVFIKLRTLLDKVVRDPKLKVLPMIAGADDPVRVVEGLIDTKDVGSSLLVIMMNGDQPDQLQTIMEVLLVKYVEESKLSMQKDNENHKAQLMNDLDIEKRTFDQQMEIIKNLNKNNLGTSSLNNSEEISRLRLRAETLATAVDDLQKKISTLEARVRQSKDWLSKPDQPPPPAIVEASLDGDVAVANAKEKLALAEENLKKVKDKIPDPDAGGPALKKYVDEVNSARTALEDVRKSRRAETVKTLSLTLRGNEEAKLLANESELAALKAEMVNAKKLANESREDYETKLKVAGTAYDIDIIGHRERVRKIQEQINTYNRLLSSQGRIVKKEDPIVIPNPNIKQKMFFGAALAGLAFTAVVLIVAFLEWRSRRVDNVDQVLNELNLRVLGTIPAFPSRASLKAGEADLNQNWRFILNESVNSARTMLLHCAKTQNMQILMVTSAMQGEGKTSLASQLATSMATAGLRTLILDMDLRNPSMNRLFDLPLGPGASEVLMQEIDVSDAVQPTSVPNLWVVPAGQCSNRVIATLAQGHMVETLFNRLRGQFDFIVVDTCPVLPVADALLIGQHVDGVVFSILQDISQLPKVLNASERLSQLNIPLLGAVVNGIKTDIHAYGYNYVKQLPA